MSAVKHAPPTEIPARLEACGNLLRTPRESDGSGGWLVAECISMPGKFAEVMELRWNTHDELVAALRGMLDAMDDGSDEPTLIAARAAVAKATGSANDAHR